jgi:hypothetical protein
MTPVDLKTRLKQKTALYPRGESNEPILELRREFAQMATSAGISLALKRHDFTRRSPVV